MTPLVAYAIQVPIKGSAPKAVLTTISAACGKKRTCELTYGQIAISSGCSESSARRAVEKLTALRLIRVTESDHSAHTYRVRPVKMGGVSICKGSACSRGCKLLGVPLPFCGGNSSSPIKMTPPPLPNCDPSAKTGEPTPSPMGLDPPLRGVSSRVGDAHDAREGSPGDGAGLSGVGACRAGGTALQAFIASKVEQATRLIGPGAREFLAEQVLLGLAHRWDRHAPLSQSEVAKILTMSRDYGDDTVAAILFGAGRAVSAPVGYLEAVLGDTDAVKESTVRGQVRCFEETGRRLDVGMSRWSGRTALDDQGPDELVGETDTTDNGPHLVLGFDPAAPDPSPFRVDGTGGNGFDDYLDGFDDYLDGHRSPDLVECSCDPWGSRCGRCIDGKVQRPDRYDGNDPCATCDGMRVVKAQRGVTGPTVERVCVDCDGVGRRQPGQPQAAYNGEF